MTADAALHCSRSAKREALDAHGAVGAHLLGVDDRDVGGEGGEEDDLVVLVGRTGSSMTTTFCARARRRGRAARAGSPSSCDHVGAEPGLAGDERHAQGAGQEAQAHHVVGVVLDQQLAALHRLAKADAGGREAAVAAVGDVEAAHAAGADQHVQRLAVGVRHEVQVLDAAAGDLVDRRHRVAGDGEAADGDLAAVGHEALDGLADGHELAVEAVVLGHLLSPPRVGEGSLNAETPASTVASQLGDRA